MATSLRKPKPEKTVSYGDFQTPLGLALEVTHRLSTLGIRPAAILEPTCGRGAFLEAAIQTFPGASLVIGVEVNEQYVQSARRRLPHDRLQIIQADFFRHDWRSTLALSDGPWLILGNPPWVTNSVLSTLASDNRPVKTNDSKLIGVEAITGKSNFDLSEWMLLRYLEWVKGSHFTIAVLCKVSVARKILLTTWKTNSSMDTARLYSIDASRHFDVSVDACLLVLKNNKEKALKVCHVYNSIGEDKPSGSITYRDGHLVSDVASYETGRHLFGTDKNYRWRSGVKHDCSKVIELRALATGYLNGFEETVSLEDDYVYPLQKGADVGKNREMKRMMVVPQRYPGQDMSEMQFVAPKTWSYLVRHRDLFRKRASSIYKGKTDFSIFGVGPYTFAPWKVAISGFNKAIRFVVVGPDDGKPVVFDDTVYFLSCRSEQEAMFLADLLNSEIAIKLLSSMIHSGSKRPITADLLKKIDLKRLAGELNRSGEYKAFVDSKDDPLHHLASYGLFEAVY